MSWFKSHFGIDAIDFAIQFVLTGFVMAGIGSIVHGPGQDFMMTSVAATSLLVFAVRRQRGLARLAQSPVGLTSGQMAAERIEDVEQRLAELEAVQARLVELEERLDFTERLLARQTEASGAKLIEERR